MQYHFKQGKITVRTVLYAIAAIFAFFISIYAVQYILLPPKSFPVPYSVTIDNGQSLFSISKELYSDGVIRSRRVFEIFMLTLGSEKTISKGEYFFERPATVITMALRIVGRDFGVERTRVTIPEGFTNKQIATRLGATLHDFDAEQFLTLAKNDEGFLFPDTYIFFPWATPETVHQTLRDTFDQKIEPFKKNIEASPYSLNQIVTMASLVEKEANGEEDRAMIAGILWNRIEKGIPLQVDAPFLYLIGKESSELTRTDLAIDSPFNTYKYKGLPPHPIGNPGVSSIEATLSPKESPYLYYLHDKDGTIYYARTYKEHLRNIKNHLQ